MVGTSCADKQKRKRSPHPGSNEGSSHYKWDALPLRHTGLVWGSVNHSYIKIIFTFNQPHQNNHAVLALPIYLRHTRASSCSTMWSIFFVLLSLSLPYAASQETSQALRPYDCIDPQNPSLTSRVEIGKNTTVCLYAGPSGDWNSNMQYKRFSVNLIGDQFSNYHVPGCE